MVCHGCVLQMSYNNMDELSDDHLVQCPDCRQYDAFDPEAPIVSLVVCELLAEIAALTAAPTTTTTTAPTTKQPAVVSRVRTRTPEWNNETAARKRQKMTPTSATTMMDDPLRRPNRHNHNHNQPIMTSPVVASQRRHFASALVSPFAAARSSASVLSPTQLLHATQGTTETMEEEIHLCDDLPATQYPYINLRLGQEPMAIHVDGAGLAVVNGIYHKRGTGANGMFYSKLNQSTTFNGTTARDQQVVYRQGNHWYVASMPVHVAEPSSFTVPPNALYYRAPLVQPFANAWLPRHGWQPASPYTVGPAPSVSIQS